MSRCLKEHHRAGLEVACLLVVVGSFAGCGNTGLPSQGRVWTIPDLGITLNWIPAGRFWMGSTPEERAWAEGPEGMAPRQFFEDEGMQPRRVIFKRGYWMGRTEVTVAQWRQFVEAAGYETEAEKKGEAWCYDAAAKKMGYVAGRNWRDTGFPFPLRDDHPVSFVTWNDASAFCAWLTARETAAGRLPAEYAYRLPGEAEWEYASRGSRKRTVFWWGDSLREGEGRMNAASRDTDGDGPWEFPCPWNDGYKFISPVDAYGERGRNGFGLADMLGNVWEWCLDGYDPAGAHSEVWTDRTNRRLLRGGAFDDRPGYLRCAVRAAPRPDDPNFARGFRLCLGNKIQP
jgi:sulfatase modifying factor 1